MSAGHEPDEAPALFTLRGVRALAGDEPRALFAPLDARVPDRAVTVLLGPAGVGKSTLLRWLATGEGPAGVRVEGSLAVRGAACEASASGAREGDPRGALAHVPQRTARRPDPAATMERVREALAGPAPAALLDEVDRWMTPRERDELAALLRDARARGGVLAVTHDLSLARAIADHALLLTPEGLSAAGPAEAFFASPANPLLERYLAQGSAWPGGPVRARLPSHFHWILPGKLAGMGRPGLLGDEDDDLAAIALEGVTLLVSLTEAPVDPARLRAVGIEGRHLAIADMGVPAVAPMARLCRAVERALEQGGVAAFHCHAGVGRTGLALASYLVWRGVDAEAAIAQVRAQIPRAIETSGQERFVRSFASQV